MCTQAPGLSGAVSQAATTQELPASTPAFNVAIPAFNPNPMMQIVRPAGGVLKRPLEQVTCFKVSLTMARLVIYASLCSVETRVIMLTW